MFITLAVTSLYLTFVYEILKVTQRFIHLIYLSNVTCKEIYLLQLPAQYLKCIRKKNKLKEIKGSVDLESLLWTLNSGDLTDLSGA